MSEIKSIDTLYEHLENEATNYNSLSKIASEFRKIRDFYIKNNNDELAKIAQYETNIFNFIIEDNTLKPMYSGTNDKGEVVEYPSLGNFDNDSYDYIKDRILNITNPCLKARYNHLLWLSPQKHTDYAKEAISCYLDLLKIYLEKEKDNPELYYAFLIINTIRNLFFLSLNAKFKIENVAEEIIDLIEDDDLVTSSAFLIKSSLIKLITEHNKRFNADQIKNISKMVWSLIDLLEKDGRPFNAIELLELGEKIDNFCNTQIYDWRFRIAELYEKLMNSAVGNINSIGFCQEAIKNYKQCNKDEKVKELEKKFGELRSNLEMSEVKTDIDIHEIIKLVDETSDSLIDKSSDYILNALMNDNTILPDYSKLEKTAKDTLAKSPLRALAAGTLHDAQGNPIEHMKEY